MGILGLRMTPIKYRFQITSKLKTWTRIRIMMFLWIIMPIWMILVLLSLWITSWLLSMTPFFKHTHLLQRQIEIQAQYNTEALNLNNKNHRIQIQKMMMKIRTHLNLHIISSNIRSLRSWLWQRKLTWTKKESNKLMTLCTI